MALSITQFFFELIQISIGTKVDFEEVPNGKDWICLYNIAEKQSLISVLIEGVNKVQKFSQNINHALLLEWIGINQLTISQNQLQNKRAGDLCKLFNQGGFRCSILKGQGTALYYEHPKYRQCGDIDVWIEGDRDSIIDYLRRKGFKIRHIDIKHSDVEIFEEVSVEVHFQPSWMYCPTTNKRLQKFFEAQSDRQFSNNDTEAGFTHTTIEFDLVFSIVHIYRHIFSEGIGLRQLMDYYYILMHSNQVQRKDAFDVLKSLKMAKFVGGIMWILTTCFGMREEYMLCFANERHGRFLLSEIMMAGNFGHYDDRIKSVSKDKNFLRGFVQLGRNLRFVTFYPSEVLWSPIWKTWHYFWRKRKGYL